MTSSVVEVRGARESERAAIQSLLDRYLFELSQHREVAVGATRAVEYPYLKDYWSDRDRFPFTIWFNNELVGFILVRGGPVFQIAEFFIEPNHRRRGIGSRAVASIFREFPGRWELQVMTANQSGLRFWEKCLQSHATSWDIEQIVAADGRRQFFHFEI